MKKILCLCLISFFSFMILFSCSGTQETDPDNYLDQGFITPDIFQVSVKGRPDRNAMGLVEQRKTAYINAEYVLKKAYLYRLSQHICGRNSVSQEKLKNTMDFLAENVCGEKGYIYETYYTETNAAVIVYRFKDKDLEKSISRIPCGGKK